MQQQLHNRQCMKKKKINPETSKHLGNNLFIVHGYNACKTTNLHSVSKHISEL